MFNRYTAIASVALALPVVLSTVQEASAHKADFWVVNNSGKPIAELYISESSVSTWLNDILGSDVLGNGDGFQVVFNDSSNYVCLYDIRAVFSDGQVWQDFGIDVCQNDFYEFYDSSQASSFKDLTDLSF